MQLSLLWIFVDAVNKFRRKADRKREYIYIYIYSHFHSFSHSVIHLKSISHRYLTILCVYRELSSNSMDYWLFQHSDDYSEIIYVLLRFFFLFCCNVFLSGSNLIRFNDFQLRVRAYVVFFFWGYRIRCEKFTVLRNRWHQHARFTWNLFS